MHPGKPVIFFGTILFLSCSNPAETDPGKSFRDWGREHATAILSLEPGDENSDLEAIGRALGDARVLVLSEGFHNCSEMMKLHHRIIAYMVEHHGFNTVVSESGLPESRLIYKYIQGEDATEKMWRDGLNKMYGQWQEGRRLIEWMRDYNLRNDNLLQYYGIDIGGFYENWKTPLGEIIDYLYQVDPDYGPQLESLLAPYMDLMDEDARVRYIEQLSPEQQGRLGMILDEAVQHFEDHREDYLASGSNSDYQWARQSTIAMQLADNYYRNYIQRSHPETSKYVGLNGREIAMATNLAWVMDQREDAKVIVIDHVIHTKTASQFQGGMWGNFTPAGQLFRQKLGDQVFIIGMAYGGGQFWNNWQDPAKRFVDSIPAYDEKGIEQILSGIGPDRFFIHWDQATGEAAHWMHELCTLRENDYNILLEPCEWNACIYLDLVHPGTPHQCINLQNQAK